MSLNQRYEAKKIASKRSPLKVSVPKNSQGRELKVSQYFGQNTFKIDKNRAFDEKTRNQISKVIKGEEKLSKELSKIIASTVLEWSLSQGATHFCHWFQPLTGSTAEKHDAFLSFDGDRPIEKLSASQLLQGEPDASSFPNGGSRSTFEARGYTSWDLTSPLFIKEGVNGKTLCIPTAFISYRGNSLDVKTPLLRSMTELSKSVTEYLRKTGFENINSVMPTCGCEQEYFLIDKSFYFQREDLVMSGRTLLGSLTSRNQQLDDHYFGTVPDRVLAFMQEFEIELYKLGIPAKTRHNEVAPGQFEIAPIFQDANISVDQNQLMMATLKSVAEKHNFICLLHEKPFAGVNGSGKHLNWSMSTDLGSNLLEPGDTPHENYRFLSFVSIVCEAVKRRSVALRAAIASQGNDHRLGANEAPPSILSVFLGDTVKEILDQFISGKEYSPSDHQTIETGASQLATLLKDNTDRNRTSPFAFTGNKFEFRAVGSSANPGVALTILNSAIIDVINETNTFLDENSDKSQEEKLKLVTSKWYESSKEVVFNGDGYGEAWVNEAEKRGLPNLKTTADALIEFMKKEHQDFLVQTKVYTKEEVDTYLNVSLERYITLREIEFTTQRKLVDRFVLPSAYNYLLELQKLNDSESASFIYKGLNQSIDKLHLLVRELELAQKESSNLDEKQKAKLIADDLMVKSEQIADLSSLIEDKLPDEKWNLPTYFDLLFVR